MAILHWWAGTLYKAAVAFGVLTLQSILVIYSVFNFPHWVAGGFFTMPSFNWTINVSDVLTIIGFGTTVAVAMWKLYARQLTVELWIKSKHDVVLRSEFKEFVEEFKKSQGDRNDVIRREEFTRHLEEFRRIELRIDDAKRDLRAEVLRSIDTLTDQVQSVHGSVHNLRNQLMEKFFKGTLTEE